MFSEGIQIMEAYKTDSNFALKRINKFINIGTLNCRGEASKSAHLLESANLKIKYMNKNYEKNMY